MKKTSKNITAKISNKIFFGVQKPGKIDRIRRSEK